MPSAAKPSAGKRAFAQARGARAAQAQARTISAKEVAQQFLHIVVFTNRGYLRGVEPLGELIIPLASVLASPDEYENVSARHEFADP